MVAGPLIRSSAVSPRARGRTRVDREQARSLSTTNVEGKRGGPGPMAFAMRGDNPTITARLIGFNYRQLWMPIVAVQTHFRLNSGNPLVLFAITIIMSGEISQSKSIDANLADDRSNPMQICGRIRLCFIATMNIAGIIAYKGDKTDELFVN